MIRNLLLLPLAEPLVGVSWSLPYEVFFYFLFACLIINARLGFTLFAAWLFVNLVLVYFVADYRFDIPVIKCLSKKICSNSDKLPYQVHAFKLVDHLAEY